MATASRSIEVGYNPGQEKSKPVLVKSADRERLAQEREDKKREAAELMSPQATAKAEAVKDRKFEDELLAKFRKDIDAIHEQKSEGLNNLREM